MNLSNFELSMDYSCNHKRVCKLSVSTRDCERKCFFILAPFPRGEDKGEGLDSRTCNFFKPNPSPSPLPFRRERRRSESHYSSTQPQRPNRRRSDKRIFPKQNGCSIRLFGE